MLNHLKPESFIYNNMNINKRVQENLKNFVLANPDIKNRGNIDEKKNKEEFKKLGSTLESTIQLMQHQSPVMREHAEMRIEEIMANIDAFFRYAMQEQVRFNQKDREEIKEQMDRIRESLEMLREISPAYARRVDSHLKTIDEIKAKTGGVKMYTSDAGSYLSGAAVNDEEYTPSIAFRINNQMNLKRNNNYLQTKLGFNEPETL